jgi:hypothetical protein
MWKVSRRISTIGFPTASAKATASAAVLTRYCSKRLTTSRAKMNHAKVGISEVSGVRTMLSAKYTS